MLFSHSLLQYAPGLSRPSILALYSDHFIGEVRLKPMLNALLKRGVIGDYQIADRHMQLVGPLKQHRFTHIWCQRNVSTRQFGFLKRHAGVPFIYDLDDLLTSPPEFVTSTRTRITSRIEWCLHHAAAVTVTSDTLARCLREDVRGLERDLVIIENGFNGQRPPPSAPPLKRLVWASGDRPYVLRDDPAFFEHLAQLANDADYEVVFIGRFDAQHLGLFKKAQHIGYLNFASYRDFLYSCAGGIGLAPLPSRLPAAAQRFFDSKSDIKLVDFLSAGMVPLVTDAVPYAESKLFVPELAGFDAPSLLKLVADCMADPAASLALVGHRVYATNLLAARDFAAISRSLDHLFR